MKIKNHFNHNSYKRFAVVLGLPVLAVGLTILPANAQVVIEGGPGAVQISDEDGKTEASTPLNNPVEPPSEGIAVPRIEGPDAVPVPNPPSTKVSADDLAAPVRPNKDRKSRDEVDGNVKLKLGESRDTVTGEVTASATAAVAPNTPVLEPEKMKRMTELERELKISNTAILAAMTMRTADLYEGDEAATINPLAAPTLTNLAEYITLSDKKMVTVQGHYVPGEGNKEMVWKRSLALIDWMTKSGAVSLDNIKAEGPEPVTQPVAVPEDNTSDIASTELVSMIEVEIR